MSFWITETQMQERTDNHQSCLLTGNWSSSGGNWKCSWLYIIAFITLSLCQANIIQGNFTWSNLCKGIKYNLKFIRKKTIYIYIIYICNEGMKQILSFWHFISIIIWAGATLRGGYQRWDKIPSNTNSYHANRMNHSKECRNFILVMNII